MSKKSNITYGVIYARYSPGPNQTDQSIEGQVRDCMEYAESHNIQIIKTYADRHLSGKDSEHRPEFQQLLKDSEKGQFSVVLTWKVDRLGRNREELAFNKHKLKKNGVSIAYAKEAIPDGPEGIILESLLEGLAEYYSAELAQKIRRGQKESFMKGKLLSSKKVYGYDKVDMMPVINEAEAEIVRKIFQQYNAGIPLVDIISGLNDSGLLHCGRPWAYSNVARILRNRMYIGEYRWKDLVNDNFPSIIDKETFDLAQERIATFTNTNAKMTTAAQAKATVNYLLSGKISCACCGNSFVGESGRGRAGNYYYYYKCRGRKFGKTKCNVPTFKKDDLENLIVDCTAADVLTDEMINYIADMWEKYRAEDETHSSAAQLEKEIKDTNKALANIMKAIEAGVFNETTQQRMQELEETKKRLEDSLRLEKIKKSPYTRKHIVCWLELFRSGDFTDEESRKELVSDFINHIVVDEECIYVVYNISTKDRVIPISEIMENVRMHSRQVDLTSMHSNNATVNIISINDRYMILGIQIA